MVAVRAEPTAIPMSEARFSGRARSSRWVEIGLSIATLLASCTRREAPIATAAVATPTTIRAPATEPPTRPLTLRPISELTSRQAYATTLSASFLELRTLLAPHSIDPGASEEAPHSPTDRSPQEALRIQLERTIATLAQPRFDEFKPLFDELEGVLQPVAQGMHSVLGKLSLTERAMEGDLREAVSTLVYASDTCRHYAQQIAQTLQLWEALSPVHQHAERVLGRLADLGIGPGATPIEVGNVLARLTQNDPQLCQLPEEAHKLTEALSAAIVTLGSSPAPSPAAASACEALRHSATTLAEICRAPTWTRFIASTEVPLLPSPNDAQTISLKLAHLQDLRECAVTAEVAIQGVVRTVGITPAATGEVAFALESLPTPLSLQNSEERILVLREIATSLQTSTDTLTPDQRKFLQSVVGQLKAVATRYPGTSLGRRAMVDMATLLEDVPPEALARFLAGHPKEMIDETMTIHRLLRETLRDRTFPRSLPGRGIPGTSPTPARMEIQLPDMKMLEFRPPPPPLPRR